MLGLLSKVFTWWNGASAGAAWTIWRSGELVGEDEFGNKYYQERKAGTGADGKTRRWVVYNGYADGSRVPSDWHGWMHHTFDEVPTDAPLPRKDWEQEHQPNMTGTLHAYHPTGSLIGGSARQRQATAADYESWTPGD
ncbi:MAG: NADH:ubiquinone oxidoreductase subunit NDUFA12 [Oceanicaulis sp.]|jgi:NADH:ubiquinone oxidoreductase subunit|uniref:NADH:ubiquinone oxidoreductase subunit NDUFA12 n=1 Tax=Oceanicaulis TaxID=153232 RepID=UPI0003B318FC|nr:MULTISPECIES: NADH:ubiquinone oxidoreductase subunit NDUFA12 [Oceanicaulis]MAP48455.1 NADH:ubiquinone oxidoreductase subunit NDUFA12 [Oceanicaulis sp.]MBL4537891.1 NADH:ubiquinone oxidoreductase subunit NDUFA12 [Oceanicaulis sp.]VXC44293.1 NADH:ubiquinone oxidoreductase subunit NDUFA12 [Oceanicaulis sp. 350]HCR65062.1 NADH:ubiquinone oxidoreductase subunit NDUFA12 [Oceanicaulis sp.]|tara:strand:- start:636 stop:1049 length:414 start_codon:yes stop_codon:yes gene_type:complete